MGAVVDELIMHGVTRLNLACPISLLPRVLRPGANAEALLAGGAQVRDGDPKAKNGGRVMSATRA